MRTKLRSKFTLLIVVCAALLAVPAVAMALVADPSGNTAPAPTVQSDKADYAPGELVTLTGSNWQPGESVNVVVNDDAGQTWTRNVDVSADASGNISDSFNLPDWFVATYKVTATGAQSGVATTSFTDGNIRIKAAPPGTSFNGTFTIYSGVDCTGTASSPDNRPTVGSANNNDYSGPVPNTSSIKIEASAYNSAGNGFQNFTAGDPAADSSRIIENGSFDPTSSPRIICINGDFPGSKTFFANYFTSNQAPVNSVPATPPPQSTNEDTALTFNTTNNNKISISDVDANPTSSLKVTLSVANGTLTLNGTSGLTFTTGDGTNDANMTFTGTLSNINTALNGMSFTPNANYFGPSLLAITTDDQGNTGTGGAKNDSDAVQIFVTPVDDNPVAVNDTKTVAEDDPATTINVLANDTDVDGGPKTIASVTQPTNGTVAITNGGNDLTYKPNGNYCNGGSPTDNFTYTLNGGSSATVAVTVTCVDDDPVAVNDTKTVAEDANATALNVLNNDTDPDGGTKTIQSVTQPTNGTVAITGGGSDLTYKPNANYCNGGSPTTSPTRSTVALALLWP